MFYWESFFNISLYLMTGLKGMRFDHDFCSFILLFFFLLFLEGNKKGGKEYPKSWSKCMPFRPVFLNISNISSSKHASYYLIELKGMTFDHDFCSFFLLFFFPHFLEGKRGGEKNNQSRDQNVCLSDRSSWTSLILLLASKY